MPAGGIHFPAFCQEGVYHAAIHGNRLAHHVVARTCRKIDRHTGHIFIVADASCGHMLTHNVAKVALRMKRYIERRNIAHPEPWQCRIGINSGPMIGSIVGVQNNGPRFIWAVRSRIASMTSSG